jgi:uracil-DNA glycosylase
MPIRVTTPAVTPATAGGSSTIPLKSLVPSDWRAALAPQIDSPEFKGLDNFLASETAAGKKIFPPRAQIFSALKQTPLKNVKVVIIGQDPYPTAGNANGLAFSVAKGMKVPASLKNIYAGLNADLGTPIPKDGDLTPWAKNGVLLLNTVLTVEEGKPNSHHNKGWEPFTEAVLKKVNEQPGPVVFLCFGAQAQQMAAKLVDPSKHTIINEPHPSPLNGHAFVDAVKRDKIFTKTNQILTAGGRGAIDWSLQ